MMGTAYFLTGEPGVGKTTALKKIVAMLGPDTCGGFYTEEIRNDAHMRTGFRLVTLDGQTAVVADVHSSSPIRVGRYGVNLENVDQLGVTSLYTALRRKRFVIVDEIGPMQLQVTRFKQAMSDMLASDKDMIGTIVLRPYPWADDLKRASNVHIFHVTEENRDDIMHTLVDRLITPDSTQVGDR